MHADRTLGVRACQRLYVGWKDGRLQLVELDSSRPSLRDESPYLIKALPVSEWRRGQATQHQIPRGVRSAPRQQTIGGSSGTAGGKSAYPVLTPASLGDPGGNAHSSTDAAARSFDPAAVNPEPEAEESALFDPVQVPRAGAGAQGMVLTTRGSANQLVFKHAGRLRNGETVVLSLAGAGNLEGKGVGKAYAEERRFGPWRYIESHICAAEDAVAARYEDGAFVKLADNDLVLDVPYARMEVGNTVNFVGGTTEQDRTTESGPARDFVINEDGTIGCMHHPHLVLGAAISIGSGSSKTFTQFD